jgi:hypothetical protein
MTETLTLAVDEELAAFAREYSTQQGITVSLLFEEYMARLKTAPATQQLNPKIAHLYGVFKDTPIPDKAELRRYFHEETAR